MASHDWEQRQVIFSLRGGDVWISSPDNRWPGRIGSYDEVVLGMRDFLAQCDVATRLSASASARKMARRTSLRRMPAKPSFGN